MLQRLMLVAALLALPISADAAEICGNGQDDDGDDLADEGCVSRVCESPLSCNDTGLISPISGALRYALPADVSPRVPFGPGLSFARYYLSAYAPGGSAPTYRKPMGERWGHTYATWLDKWTAPTPDQVVVHTNRGQDVLFKYSGLSGDGVWDEYNTFQTGFHFKSLRQRTISPNEYELKMLTGDVLIYNASGKLTEIRDTLGNAVLVAYDGNGQLSTVTDAAGKRRLLFSYARSVLTSVVFQISISSVWTTQHTTSYGYTGADLLTYVTIGGSYAQTNVYDGAGYLTQVQEGLSGNAIVSFSYDSATAGKVVRVDTARGMVGFEYASSRASCSGQTVLHFNRGNRTSCSVDGDCGSGFLCGGKTGSGSTGVCFRAARCMTVTSPSDDVVTSITALGPPSETCDGACLDVAEYVWNTTGVLDLTATKDPSGKYTTRTFDTNGLPTAITYGDADATPGGGLREVFLYYDASFPGRVKEVRRKSDLSTQASSCSSSTETGCAQTKYVWNSSTGLLDSQEELGFQLNVDGSVASFRHITSFSYDAQGRLTQIDGPLSGTNDVTVFEYWSSTDVLKDGLLQNYKRKKDTTSFVTQSSLSYDFWGNPTSMTDADGTVSCQIFDAARGYLTQRRETMAAQTDCTANTADLVTSYERSAGLQLTKLTRPDGSCIFYEYDTKRRLAKTKRRDDCNASSSGDREEYTYSDDGLLTKIETFDASSTVTRRQELTYFDSRRLDKLLNPVDTSKWTGISYDARGLVNEVAAGSSSATLSKTAWTHDDEGRVATEKRSTAGTAFDTWNLLFDWIGNQKQVTDGDSMVTKSTRDDLGRVTKLESPDLGGFPTLRVYDAASRLVSIAEVFGGSGVQTHAFTFDNLGRPLDANYHGDCEGTDNADIQRIYDSLGGISCPISDGCNNLSGRLAYVKVKLMCSSSYGDKSLDQETFYSYDAAGRVIREHITDDSGRNAKHEFTWTKSGALAQSLMPSNTIIGSTFGSTGSNSDTDRVTALWRTSTSTPIIDNVLWTPYGPLTQYNQMNTLSSSALRTRITRNLAYRISEIVVEKQSDGVDVISVGITEDAKGRVVTRDYWPNTDGVQDSYFQYDLQDRVLCETTTSASSCPTSGTNIKNSHSLSPPFTAAGDWKRDLRPIAGSTCLINDFTLASGTHQISTVSQPDGTPTSCTPVLGNTDIRYNSRGDRSYDDNSTSLTNDRRDITYDARRNVINVRGRYYLSGSWRYYQVASAFDAQNRRVFKSFYDETTTKLATFYFSYDALDRLVETRYTPDTSVATTYEVYQHFWLADRLVLHWATQYPAVNTWKAYAGTDESGRAIELSFMSSGGDAVRGWAINPRAWAMDTTVVGSGAFPFLFAGQFQDTETAAYLDDGATIHRPGLALNGFRTYDPFTGGYLQVDPLVPETWSSYGYCDSDPIGKTDPSGLMVCYEARCDAGTYATHGGIFTGYCGGYCKPLCEALDFPLPGCDCSVCRDEDDGDGDGDGDGSGGGGSGGGYDDMCPWSAIYCHCDECVDLCTRTRTDSYTNCEKWGFPDIMTTPEWIAACKGDADSNFVLCALQCVADGKCDNVDHVIHRRASSVWTGNRSTAISR